MNNLVSIILPVHNGAKTIGKSISSILKQTYRNFELIIVNDGSYDDSLHKISSFNDPRITLYNQKNMGLSKTLNFGVSVATGDLIARQDQDDISLPIRIERQVERFKQNRKLVLLGTYGLEIDDNERFTRKLRFPSKNTDLKYLLNFYNPFIHSSVVIRTKALLDVGGYAIDSRIQPPEDFELWNRLKVLGELENLKEFLVLYRRSSGGMGQTYKEVIETNYSNLVVNNIKNVFDFSLNDSRQLYSLQFNHKNSVSHSQRYILVMKLSRSLLRKDLKIKPEGIKSKAYLLKMLGKILLK
jgi:glycosyltransferase involved in cell wall biosynthesis